MFACSGLKRPNPSIKCHGSRCNSLMRGKCIRAQRQTEMCNSCHFLSLSFQLVVRVHLSDESSKTMMVDERQTVRQVLDSLLDKSHCGYSLDWSLVEIISELQMGKSQKTDTVPFYGEEF